MSFWTAFLAVLAALAVLGVVMVVFWRPAMRQAVRGLIGPFLERLVRDPYTKNLASMFTVIRHVGPQVFMETQLRASGGGALERPMGSPLQPSPWQQLYFQPVYLRPRMPTPADEQIEMRTVIGPRAQKPLHLDIPILIAGMSYGGALSVQAKLALAKGANLAGTATNSGESYLPEERQAADRLIVQHHRGLWGNGTMQRPELLRWGDAIEIHLGQGAQAAAAMRTEPTDQAINAKMRSVYGLEEGERAQVATRFRGVDSPEAFVDMVRKLKQDYPVPVGAKLGVSDYIEQDLEVLLDAGVDFVTIDGAEGGTHGGPAALQDDVGLPTMHGLVRADDYLRQAGRRDAVTLIAAGQMTSPGRCLKALALGADAVYIGTVAILSMLSDQAKKTLPWEPTCDMVMHSAGHRWNAALDVEHGARSLANYLDSAVTEMRYVVQTLGKTDVHALDRGDMVALDAQTASLCGVRLAWRRHAQAAGEAMRPEEAASR